MTLEFDYSKLKGRIVEKYGSQGNFAKEIPVSENQLSVYLTGKKRITTRLIDKMVVLLDIPEQDIGSYFFTQKVR